MSEKRDYYDVLGLSKNATDEEIKCSYRNLVKQYHPDVCKGDKIEAESIFKEISEAYEVLMNPEKRQRYDRYGHAGIDNSWGHDGFTWQDFSHVEDLEDLFGQNIFTDFFSNFGFVQSNGRARGSSLRMSVTISLEDAYNGVEKELDVPQTIECTACDGTGAKDGKLERCGACNGTGQIRSARSAGFAQFVSISTCPRCNGAGRKAKDKCPDCNGKGVIEKDEKLKISIPQGVDTGLRLRVPGKGDLGHNGGSRGDLYVYIQVEPHEKFKRENDDLYIELPISFSQATLGDEITVPTLDGDENLKIPEYTQTNTVLKIKGKGMPSLSSSSHGDLFVRVIVKTPTDLTPRQKELMREFATISGEKITKKGLFKKFTSKL